MKIVIFTTKPLKKLDKDTALQLNECFTFALVVLKKYCMTPKYAEKFNFIIDMDGKGLRPQVVFFFGVKKKDLIKGLINLFQDNLNGFNTRCYIYNAPWTFNMIWAVVKRKFILGLKSL
jgi:hypothetical protein